MGLSPSREANSSPASPATPEFYGTQRVITFLNEP